MCPSLELITVLLETDFVIDQSESKTGHKDYEVETVNRRQDSQTVLGNQTIGFIVSQSPLSWVRRSSSQSINRTEDQAVSYQ